MSTKPPKYTTKTKKTLSRKTVDFLLVILLQPVVVVQSVVSTLRGGAAPLRRVGDAAAHYPGVGAAPRLARATHQPAGERQGAGVLRTAALAAGGVAEHRHKDPS